MNEENKSILEEEKESSIDFGKIFQDLLKHKRLYYKVLPVAFVLAAIYALAQPNYYNCTVKLSPEMSGSKSTSGLASLASSFGVNLGGGGAGTEALFPTLYPDLVNSTDFKTTLFHVLAGLTLPEEGKVFLEGKDVTGKPGKVAYMLQKDMLLAHKKVIDNVSLPLVLQGKSKKEARQKADPFFEEFGLAGTQYQYPVQLSGGMRQRAALLRTWLASEGVALLDEPFSALDSITKTTIHRWYLDVMKKIDLSTLFITHDIDEAILLSDRIYILTGSPGVIKDEILLPPRDQREDPYNLTSEFLSFKKEILSRMG